MEHNGIRVVISFIISGLILFFSLVGPKSDFSFTRAIRGPASSRGNK